MGRGSVGTLVAFLGFTGSFCCAGFGTVSASCKCMSASVFHDRFLRRRVTECWCGRLTVLGARELVVEDVHGVFVVLAVRVFAGARELEGHASVAFAELYITTGVVSVYAGYPFSALKT